MLKPRKHWGTFIFFIQNYFLPKLTNDISVKTALSFFPFPLFAPPFVRQRPFLMWGVYFFYSRIPFSVKTALIISCQN
jgi:hypothetical protein